MKQSLLFQIKLLQNAIVRNICTDMRKHNISAPPSQIGSSIIGYIIRNEGKDVYQKDSNTESLLEQLKKELEEIQKKCRSKEEYSYYVYQKIGDFINALKVSTGYVIGVKYVQALLKMFLGDEHLLQNVYFYNRDKSVYIAIHQVTVGRITHYFAYKKTPEGNYEMHEVTPEVVELYYSMYSYKLSKDLKNTLIPTLKWK